MEPSPEIEAVFRRMLEALRSEDGAAVRNLYSKGEHVRLVLTGEGEWFGGHEEAVGLSLARTRESGIVRFEFDRLEGFEEGKAGWVAARVVGHRISGDPLVLRHTLSLVLEAGAWRIVQWHVSSSSPNVEVFGHEMPKSLDDLVSSFEAAPADFTVASPAGTVTVMFTDVADSTVVSERVGDEQWTQMIADHFALLDQLVERRGGTVVKTLGDGTMNAFGSAGSAVDAAVDIQRVMAASDLDVRIGLHTGDSLHRDSDYFGVAVNKAARIAALAEGGEIIVSSVTAELAGGHGVGFGTARTVTLKGLDGTHVVVPVDWNEPQPGPL